MKNEQFQIYFDWTVLMDQTVENNITNITLRKKEKKFTLLTDVLSPLSPNFYCNYIENVTKILKYSDLEDQIKEVGDQSQVCIIQVLPGAMQEILHSQRESLFRLMNLWTS